MIHGIISILIMLTVIVIYGEIRKWLLSKKLRNFSSPRQLPIIGAIGRVFGKSNSQLIEVILNIYKEVESTPIQAWMGPILVVALSEPEDVQAVLTDDRCLNKPYFYDHLKCNTSIIATDKEVWKPNRRALNSAFNIKMLQSYVPTLNEKARVLVTKFEPFLNKPGDLYRTIFIAMIDMVIRSTMGTEMQLQSKRGASIYKIAKQLMNNIQYRVSRYWLRWDFTYSLTKTFADERVPLQNGNNFIDEIYERKLNEINLFREQGIDRLKELIEENRTNILERCILLEQDGVFSHENVLDQMRVIILAGIDTSSITIFSTLLMLAIHQKHQELVLAELRSIFDTADCEVTQTHLSSMRYLDLVMKESMRLLSPVPFIGRKNSGDIELTKGTIPKNTMILINIMHMHRNPKIWGSNANEFDPERFLPENVAKRPPFSYIPFSAGNRNCIGMKYALISAKITLAYLLRNYKFTSELLLDEIRLNTHLVLEIINENPLFIEKREF